MAGEAGQGCVHRADFNAQDFTVVSGVTASAAGNVTRCAVYGSSAGTEDVEFAMLDNKGGNDFGKKSPEQASGTITDGVDGGAACYEFEAGEHYTVFNAEIGDYLACWTNSNQEIDTWGGGPMWGDSGDNYLSDNSHTYSSYPAYEDALIADISAEVGGVAPTSVIYGPLMGPMGGPI
jgi:hypothetical protein